MVGMNLRQCGFMYIFDDDGNAKVWCEKKDRKGSLHKCLKCFKKSEGVSVES
jgi:hypothetical protein